MGLRVPTRSSHCKPLFVSPFCINASQEYDLRLSPKKDIILNRSNYIFFGNSGYFPARHSVVCPYIFHIFTLVCCGSGNVDFTHTFRVCSKDPGATIRVANLRFSAFWVHQPLIVKRPLRKLCLTAKHNESTICRRQKRGTQWNWLISKSNKFPGSNRMDFCALPGDIEKAPTRKSSYWLVCCLVTDSHGIPRNIPILRAKKASTLKRTAVTFCATKQNNLSVE